MNIPDANVLLAGGLVEESGPPVWGIDSWPLEWAATLDIVRSLVSPTTTVVPGHGALVDRDFLDAQRDQVGAVATMIADLAGSGVSAQEAALKGGWPCPVEHLADAITRDMSTCREMLSNSRWRDTPWQPDSQE